MTRSANNPRVRLRIDPWAADYDGAQGQLDGDEPAASVDVTVERLRWAAVQPEPAATTAVPRLRFVDGVRRIDCRFVAELGDRRAPGLFGSFGVGAVHCERTAVLLRQRTGRVAAVVPGIALGDVVVKIGGADACYRRETAADNSPDAPLRALQNAMRRAEAELAAELADGADAVIVDGPLSPTLPDGAFVGYVKRLLRSWLPAAQQALLPQLARGERTPLFAIRGAPLDRFAWYLRIGSGRDIDTDLAGVVRCECAMRIGLGRAQRLADLCARELPRFASDPLRDPRAPQNLYPIGALETSLRHLLGDPLLMRRALEGHAAVLPVDSADGPPPA